MMDNTPLPMPGYWDANRRAEPRRRCTLEVSCQPITVKPCDLWWLAEITDVSTSGVGMLSTRRLERGTFVAIQFANPISAFSKTKIARVMHVAPSEGKWLVGCVFQTPLDSAEMEVLTNRAHQIVPCTSNSPSE
jgi:hypothetical protein